MTTEPPVEKLARSPLVYVVAQVRIGAVLKMGDYVPEIQEHMRQAGYALYRLGEVRDLQFGPGGTALRVARQWAFDRIDRTAGFLVQEGSVTFHTTAYDTHETFFAELRQGLQIVQDAAGIGAIERLGLRYVDAFQPDTDRSLADYLKPGLRGVALDDIGARRPRSFTNLITETDVGGRLVVRIGLNSIGVLPPDLTPPDLVLARTFGRDQPIAVLDYDHFIEQTEPFSVARAIEQFNALHGIVSAAFGETVSAFALETWGGLLAEIAGQPAAERAEVLAGADLVAELKSTLGINVTDLAMLVRVSRQTIYDWIGGGQVSEANYVRLLALRRVCLDWKVRVERPVGRLLHTRNAQGRSLLDLLGQEPLDHAPIGPQLDAMAAKAAAQAEERRERHARLAPLSEKDQYENALTHAIPAADS